jgi:hypothetical protein
MSFYNTFSNNNKQMFYIFQDCEVQIRLDARKRRAATVEAIKQKIRRTDQEVSSSPPEFVRNVSGPWYTEDPEHAPDGVDEPEPPVENSPASPAAVRSENVPSGSKSLEVDEVN